MEMKKQVLSFSEFVNEAYNGYNKLMEGEGADALIEAISKLDSAGISKDALNELGIISGIAKAVATKESPDSEGALGNSILSFIKGITETGVNITNVESKINVITYDNVVAETILREDGERVKLLDWLYILNLFDYPPFARWLFFILDIFFFKVVIM